MITESFDLPSDVDHQAEKLAYFIASLFLKYFENRISYNKTKSNENIVKYHEYYRLAKQYRNEGKQLFNISRKYYRNTLWGHTDIIIYSKNKILPEITLKITDGYSHSNSGYVAMDETHNYPTGIYILIDKDSFIKSFKKSTDELIDTLKHEIRHWIQISKKVGLPKEKVLNRKADKFGFSIDKKHGYTTKEPHGMRDIEFKTNVHSFAFHLKKYLIKNHHKQNWKSIFNDIILANPIEPTITSSPLLLYLEQLDHMKKKDTTRWKQFVKELYILIFER